MTSTEEPEDATGTSWRIQGHRTLPRKSAVSSWGLFKLAHRYATRDGNMSSGSGGITMLFLFLNKASRFWQAARWNWTQDLITFPPKKACDCLRSWSLLMSGHYDAIKDTFSRQTFESWGLPSANSSAPTDIQYQSQKQFTHTHTSQDTKRGREASFPIKPDLCATYCRKKFP